MGPPGLADLSPELLKLNWGWEQWRLGRVYSPPGTRGGSPTLELLRGVPWNLPCFHEHIPNPSLSGLCLHCREAWLPGEVVNFLVQWGSMPLRTMMMTDITLRSPRETCSPPTPTCTRSLVLLPASLGHKVGTRPPPQVLLRGLVSSALREGSGATSLQSEPGTPDRGFLLPVQLGTPGWACVSMQEWKPSVA